MISSRSFCIKQKLQRITTHAAASTFCCFSLRIFLRSTFRKMTHASLSLSLISSLSFSLAKKRRRRSLVSRSASFVPLRSARTSCFPSKFLSDARIRRRSGDDARRDVSCVKFHGEISFSSSLSSSLFLSCAPISSCPPPHTTLAMLKKLCAMKSYNATYLGRDSANITNSQCSSSRLVAARCARKTLENVRRSRTFTVTFQVHCSDREV